MRFDFHALRLFLAVFSMAVAMILSLGSIALGENSENSDDAAEYHAGLVAKYKSGDALIHRVDESATVDRRTLADPRLVGVNRLSVSWSGRLFVRYSGRYTVRPFAHGHVAIRLNSEDVVDEKTSQSEWLEPFAVDLEYGWHPIEISYESASDDARFGLFWSSDQFATEPITAWFHEPSATTEDWFDVGRREVSRLGCANCHDIPAAFTRSAPALDKLNGNMRFDWLVEYLSHNGHGDSTTAPIVSLNESEARAIATSLISTETIAPNDNGKLKNANRKNGERLFHTVGCFACHSLDGIGAAIPDSIVDLTSIAEKRPDPFFHRWLEDPESVNSQHRMPQFDLTAEELRDLSAFLSSRTASPTTRRSERSESPVEAAKLIAAKKCQACHSLPKSFTQVSDEPLLLTVDANWERSCIGRPRNHQPHFRITVNSRKAIRHYVSTIATLSTRPIQPHLSGRELIAEHNCLACHSRGNATGLADIIEQVVSRNGDLKEHVSAMTPPSLNSIGDKLTDDAIRRSVQRADGARRPWKKVRMPKFNLTDEQIAAMVASFTYEDRVPPLPRVDGDLPESGETFVAGSRLVTSDGFGCTSCHQIGETKPNEAPAHLLGPDLSMIGKRVRQQWFRRWLKNPANIIPRVEMPSVQQPVRGVLDDNLSNQVAAVWHVLNRPGFEPPLPNPVRVVRQSGAVGQNSRAEVLTDVLQYNGNVIVKPFAIGLPNRHSVLLDLEHARFLDWSIGDVARQRTEGKTWFWEWAGEQLLSGSRMEDPTIHLIVNDRLVAPNRGGQFMTEPHQWWHDRGGLVLKRRLSFTVSDEPKSVWIEENFQPSNDRSGFTRLITLSNLPNDSSAQFQTITSTQPFVVNGNSVRWESRAGFGVTVTATSLSDSQEVPIAIADDGSIRVWPERSVASVRLDYVSSVQADRYLLPDLPKVEAPLPDAIRVSPGFVSVRLPVGYESMPTGFSWRSDGAMFVTSLKGRVWSMRDTNGDGVEDSADQFSDELAAPFGIQAFDDHVDVVNKGGLLRLTDSNGDGRADMTQTIASGWGHTDDYHDWTIGLPLDGQNYFASVACQQDERSSAAARLRGKVIKFSPRTPTVSHPHLFDVIEVSGGHRFSVGIARSRNGDLFVSDNQGNYNPYNELNHVRQGLRYGFINEIEKGTIEDPPLTPPAINIPHPWTRSVNGICFLESPRKVGLGIFGPFEGHIVGCEYDTRRLVRMSLQRVGDTFQGAVYPFSYTESGTENPLLGPVACAISPRGELYIGEMRDSGWGAGNNTGAIVQMRMVPDDLPCGIAEVRLDSDGFEIEFTRPIEPTKAEDVANYAVSSATRISTPAYGGDDRNRRFEAIRSAKVSDGARIVHLKLDDLRIGYVYEFHLKSLLASDQQFFPAEAYYSLNQTVLQTFGPQD